MAYILSFHPGCCTQSQKAYQEAFDIALSYTGERKSHGRPVREWSLAAGVIADMAIRLETTRATVYNLARMLDQPQVYGPPFSPQMSSRAAIATLYASSPVAHPAHHTFRGRPCRS